MFLSTLFLTLSSCMTLITDQQSIDALATLSLEEEIAVHQIKSTQPLYSSDLTSNSYSKDFVEAPIPLEGPVVVNYTEIKTGAIAKTTEKIIATSKNQKYYV